MSNIAKTVTDLVEDLIDKNGFELVDVNYTKEGKDRYLRIFIDKREGVNLDDCELISKQISKLLDEKDPIPHSYILEVSSPGIERPLKKDRDFERFAGKKVVVKTYAPIDGRKKFEGILLGMEEGNVFIDTEKQKYTIPKEKIASAHLTVELF